MRAGTHLAFAGLLAVGAAGFGSEITPPLGAALAFGALLPDVDTRGSGLGRLARPASGWLERRFGHRTLTHSLLGLAGVAVIASPLLLIHKPLWIALLAGYGSHLLLDTANVSGVPLLWPLRLRFWLVGNRAWRVPYGSPAEGAWLAAILALGLALAPLSRDGFTPWFHRALGTSYGAVEDYLRWKDSREVWAAVRGSNLVTGEAVAGRYRVIDALHSEMILVEDDQGRAYAVGRGQQADIRATRVRVWAGEPQQTATERVTVQGGTIGDLLALFPADTRHVHVTATLQTPDPTEPDHPVGNYQRVRRVGTTLELRSATPAELAPLSHLWIDHGRAVVRMAFASGVEPAAVDWSAARRAGERVVMTLADLPGLAAIQVAVGDRIEVGDVVARLPAGPEASDRRRALRAAEARKRDLDRERTAAQQTFENRRARLEAEAELAREAFERTAWLVARGALPALSLDRARADVIELERSSAEQAATAHSERRRWQRELRAAEAEFERLATRLAATLAALEVRSSVAGHVASIRTVASDQRGLEVEVVVLTAGGERP